MSIMRAINAASKIANMIDKANKRSLREHEKRERGLERARKRALAEEKQIAKLLAREDKKRNKEKERKAFADEKRVFEERVFGRKQLRLNLINKKGEML